MNLPYNLNDLRTQINELQNLGIMPEALMSDFMKLEAANCLKEGNEQDVILHLSNSLGIELRNAYEETFEAVSTSRFENYETDADTSNILQPDNMKMFKSYQDIINVLKQFPEEWTVVQISRKFTPEDVININNAFLTDSQLYITRYHCGQLADLYPPYMISIKSADSDVIKTMQNLQLVRSKFFRQPLNLKLRRDYETIDKDFTDLITSLEKVLLGCWRCLLNGRLEDKELENNNIAKIKQIIGESFIKLDIQSYNLNYRTLDLMNQASKSAHLLTNIELNQLLSYALGVSNSQHNKKHVSYLVEKIKLLNVGQDFALKRSERYPVILILDNVLETFPWEEVNTIRDFPVCRISSLHLLNAVFQHHKKHIVNGYRQMCVKTGFSLINPGGDLKSCEELIVSYIDKHLSWLKYETSNIPEADDLLKILATTDFYMYCGHGSGIQHLKLDCLRRSNINAVLFLFGCSSNAPKNTGGRTPFQNQTYSYITQGSPCVVGCLYEVSSKQVDAACIEILKFTLKQDGSDKMQRSNVHGNILQVVKFGRDKCYKQWERSSITVRGIPCKIIQTN